MEEQREEVETLRSKGAAIHQIIDALETVNEQVQGKALLRLYTSCKARDFQGSLPLLRLYTSFKARGKALLRLYTSSKA